MASCGGRGIFILAFLVLLFIVMNKVQCQPLPSERRQLANEAIFDVSKFKAKGDGKTDNSQALIRTWLAACGSGGPAKVLIPRGGNFMSSEVVFTGPCNATKPITIEIQGTLSASNDISAYSQQAWIQIERVDGVIVTGGGTIDGRGAAVWKYSTRSNKGARLPVSIIFMAVQNTRIFNLKFLNSMGVHLKVTDSRDVDISQLTITAPDESPNTDGIHLSSSTNVKISSSVIGTGDDCVSIGEGTENILVSGVTCGPGHGLSIGSLGKRKDELSLKGITVRDSTLIGTTNGARIKTYHDSPTMEASNIIFENLVMKGVRNPILIDQHYDSSNRRKQSSVRLSDIHFRNIRGTTASPIAININCSSLVPCLKVELANINLTPFNSSITNITSSCSNANIIPRGQLIPAAPVRCK
ncbi:hypothetical protein C2S51_029604 [Perilla frutescens var. frutescens]|nr:hypothetical protein C2S51_029604 [Perilla frutescens var. frutescens]